MFKGTTGECFEDLTKRVTDTQPRRALATVLQIDYAATFALWLKAGVQAKGDNLIRLRVTLEMLGYQVTEWLGLPTALHYVAEALAYEVLTLDQAREGLGYKTSKDAYRVLLRGAAMLPEREIVTKRFVATIEEEVVRARMSFHTRLQMAHSDIAAILPEMSKPMGQDQILTPDAVCLSNQELMGVFAAQINAMLPLARHFSGDSVTAEERAELRKLVGHDEVSDFSLAIRNLTSEKTRENLAQSKKGGRIR